MHGNLAYLPTRVVISRKRWQVPPDRAPGRKNVFQRISSSEGGPFASRPLKDSRHTTFSLSFAPFFMAAGISKKSRLSIAGLPARFLGVVGRTCQKFIRRACQRQAAQAREVNLVALVFWSTVAARWRRCGCLAAVSER